MRMSDQQAATAALKRTPLYDQHRELGARLVEFGGWEMPVQYRGIIEEHRAVRERAGLFDVSHMGEFTCRGRRARWTSCKHGAQQCRASWPRIRRSTHRSAAQRRHGGRPADLPHRRRATTWSSSTPARWRRIGPGSPSMPPARRHHPHQHLRRDGADRAARPARRGDPAAAAPRPPLGEIAYYHCASRRGGWHCVPASRAPATPARTASSCTPPGTTRRALWDAADAGGRRHMVCSQRGWARATRCAWRRATASTATS